MTVSFVVGSLVVFALALGAACAWLLLERGRTAIRIATAETMLGSERGGREQAEARSVECERVLDGLRAQLSELKVEATGFRQALEHEQADRRSDRAHWERQHATEIASIRREKEALEKSLGEFEERTRSVFGKLAGDALSKQSADFLNLAEQKFEAKKKAADVEMEKRSTTIDSQVQRIAEALKQTHEKLGTMEGERKEHLAALAEQIRGVNESQRMLRDETGKLVNALKRPEVRGRYGELQLRRVAELSGMVSYCDFAEQASQRDGDGRLTRPDMVVRLPNERMIAVDAKTNTLAYIEAAEAADDGKREECLERFARHVSEQVTALGKKAYWSDLKGSPEFVVMFVPGDQFLDAAMARRSDLLEKAAECGVILASPSTLIGLLRAVAVGWREKRIEEQAQELFTLGKQLHERMSVVLDHLRSLGGAIESAVKHYNNATGSIESRLTPTMRKFEDAGARSAKELPELGAVVVTTRRLDGVSAVE